MIEANGMEREITLRLLAQTTHGTHTLRILFRETHGPNETILAVIDGVSAKLGVPYATPSVTLITNCPTAGAPNTTYSYGSLPGIRVGDVDSTKELSVICNYESPMLLSKFIHLISKRGNDTGSETTSPQQVLRCLIDNIDDLLPDAHGRGVTFVGDVKRLIRGCGADFPSILPILLPHLIRISETGHVTTTCCRYGEVDQKIEGRILLEFIVEEHPDAASPFLLFLETLSMRFFSFSNDYWGWQWTVSFVPLLLPLIKKRGGVPAMRSIWTEYFPVLKEAIDKCTLWHMDRTAGWITAVKDCVEQLGAEGVTAKEMADIVMILTRALHKWEAKLEEKKKKKHRGGMRQEEEGMLKSIGEFATIGCEIFGSSFFTELRPLFPLLCSFITNFDWGASVYKNLSERAPELLDYPHLRSSFANKPIISTSNHSVSKKNVDDDRRYFDDFDDDNSSAVSLCSNGNSSQVPIEFEAFQQLFEKRNKGYSININEREFVNMSYEAIPHHVKANFLWRISLMKSSEKGRMLALKDLWDVFHNDSKKVFAGWGQLKTDEFCAQLLEMVQTETNGVTLDKFNSIQFISLSAEVASQRVVFDEGAGVYIQQWREMINFIVCSYSESSDRMMLALEIIKYAPNIAGSELFSLFPLFKRAMEHDELSVRMAAFRTFETLFRNDCKLPEFEQLIPHILTSVRKNGKERDKAFECMLSIANQSLPFILPHFNEMLNVCTNFISNSNPSYRRKTFLILTKIFNKGWDEDLPVLLWPSIQVLCKELIEVNCAIFNFLVPTFPALSTEGDGDSLIQLVAAITRCHYKSKIKWTELLMFIDTCSQNINHLARSAIDIIKQSPSVLFGASENVMNNVKMLFKGCGRKEQWREVVIEAFVSLVREGSCDGDRRTINLISDLTPALIEVFRCEVASGRKESRSLYSLYSIVGWEVMQPHLPAILNVYRDSTLKTKSGMSQFVNKAIKKITCKIASQTINIHCTWKADKTAFVSSLDLNGTFNEIEVDTDDYMNDKIVHFRCPCGYIKRDVMCIGDAVDREQKLFHFCGGIFILISRSTVECSRCRKTSSRLSFTCPFCALESVVILNKPIRGQAVQFFPRSKNPDRPPLTNHGA